jgi:hypothetical protein
MMNKSKILAMSGLLISSTALASPSSIDTYLQMKTAKNRFFMVRIESNGGQFKTVEGEGDKTHEPTDSFKESVLNFGKISKKLTPPPLVKDDDQVSHEVVHPNTLSMTGFSDSELNLLDGILGTRGTSLTITHDDGEFHISFSVAKDKNYQDYFNGLNSDEFNHYRGNGSTVAEAVLNSIRDELQDFAVIDSLKKIPPSALSPSILESVERHFDETPRVGLQSLTRTAAKAVAQNINKAETSGAYQHEEMTQGGSNAQSAK